MSGLAEVRASVPERVWQWRQWTDRIHTYEEDNANSFLTVGERVTNMGREEDEMNSVVFRLEWNTLV